MSRLGALSWLAFAATTMIALGLARPMRLASWGIAEPRECGEREAAGGRVAVTRARASQPRDFSMPAARSRPCGAGDDGTPRSGGEDLVPLGDAVGLGGQRGVGIALALHRLDGVALLDGVHRLQALYHLAEPRVLAIQPVGLDVGVEEMAAGGLGGGVGHRQHPGPAERATTARRGQAAMILFHAATRSALAASAASASPSIFTDLMVSPCLTASTASRPSTTLPNTVCLPSSQSVLMWVMKNWLPLVLGPALAIDSTPRSCLTPLLASSSNL